MDNIKMDFVTLGMDAEKMESLTIKEARVAYHKAAKEMHPDKADPTNLEEVARYTAAFQNVGNCYQRILMFLVNKLKEQECKEEDESTNDDEIFIKKIVYMFNFPCQNSGSFTVYVEDKLKLAEVWQECLENQHGEPNIFKNENGTECDQLWKFFFGQDAQKLN